MAWEGLLTPLRPGPLTGTLTAEAVTPVLPGVLPGSGSVPIPERFLVNLFAPCRYEVRTATVPLPALAAEPLPPLPPDMPPYVGLIGVWESALAVAPAEVRLREPFEVQLAVKGYGSRGGFRPPAFAHPDLDASDPRIEYDAATDTLRVRWTAAAARVPLAPPGLAFSTFDETAYVPHRLPLPVRILGEDPAVLARDGLPPALMCFHPLPTGGRADALYGRKLLLGVWAALLGAAGGVGLAWSAHRRDWRASPAGRRQAALNRLRQAGLRQADEVPLVYRDLREWLGLGPAASAQDIERALRPLDPELAEAIRSLECERFAPAGLPAAAPGRVTALLRRMRGVVLLAAFGGVLAGRPWAGVPAAGGAQEAFRKGDFAGACLALLQSRQACGAFPEWSMNLANACWFTGRHIEALALYERAARLAPRRRDIAECLAWMKGRLGIRGPGLESGYPAPPRDWLRPDEWLCLAGFLAGAGASLAGWVRWAGRAPRKALLPTGVAVCICLHFALGQWAGPYRRDATFRLTRAVPLRCAPADAAVPLGDALPPGTVVATAEWSADWVMVRTPAAQGWVPATHCVAVW